MKLFTKTNHGIEYLYALIGKKQVYLGPKNTPDKINPQNAYKAVKLLDKSFDTDIKNYLDDLDTLLSYLPEDKRKEYRSLRLAELQTRLRRSGVAPRTSQERTSIKPVRTIIEGERPIDVSGTPRSENPQWLIDGAMITFGIPKELARDLEFRSSEIQLILGTLKEKNLLPPGVDIDILADEANPDIDSKKESSVLKKKHSR